MKIVITRKIVLSLVSVLVVAAMAALSGLPWSQASGSEAGVQLVAADSRAVLTVADLQPGDTVRRSVTIRNSTDEPVRLAFTEQGAPSSLGGLLRLGIDDGGGEVYAGEFGAMADLTQDMGEVAAGGSTTFRFTVALSEDATPTVPGQQVAQATYAWVLVPLP